MLIGLTFWAHWQELQLVILIAWNVACQDELSNLGDEMSHCEMRDTSQLRRRRRWRRRRRLAIFDSFHFMRAPVRIAQCLDRKRALSPSETSAQHLLIKSQFSWSLPCHTSLKIDPSCSSQVELWVDSPPIKRTKLCSSFVLISRAAWYSFVYSPNTPNQKATTQLSL